MSLKNILIGLIVLTTVMSIIVIVGWTGASVTGSVTKMSFALDSLSVGVLGLIILTLIVLVIDLILFRRRSL